MLFALLMAFAFAIPSAYGEELAQLPDESDPTASSSYATAESVANQDAPVSDEPVREVTLNAKLLQGGAFPNAAQIGGAWDGVTQDEADSIGLQSSGDLDTQAVRGEEQLKATLLDAMLNYEESVNISAYGFYLDRYGECDELMDVYSSVVNAHPDLFYVETAFGISCSWDGRVLVLSPGYAYAPEQLEVMSENYEAKLAELLSWVPTDGTPAEKAKAAHDWIDLHCEYNDDAAEIGDPDLFGGWYPWNAYGALVEGSAVCQGYALAYRDAMNRLGIPSTYLSANDHAWNCVVVAGQWYHVDATWDDNSYDWLSRSEVVSDDYFLKSDEKVVLLDYENGYAEPIHYGWADDIHATSTIYDDKRDWPEYTSALNPIAVTSFALSASSLNLESGQTAALSIARYLPSTGTVSSIEWSASDSSVASVDSNGQVTAGWKPGVTDIVCTLNGISRTCAVHVTVRLTDANVALASTSFSYNGGYPVNAPVFVRIGGMTLVNGTDYEVRYEGNTAAGTAFAIVSGVGDYTGSVRKSFTISKAKVPLTVKVAKKKVKFAKVKRKAQKVSALSLVGMVPGNVTYSKVASGSSKRLDVNKSTGKITVKKGTKKGSYKIKVNVEGSGTDNYEPASKVVTVKIKVSA